MTNMLSLSSMDVSLDNTTPNLDNSSFFNFSSIDNYLTSKMQSKLLDTNSSNITTTTTTTTTTTKLDNDLIINDNEDLYQLSDVSSNKDSAIIKTDNDQIYNQDSDDDDDDNDDDILIHNDSLYKLDNKEISFNYDDYMKSIDGLTDNNNNDILTPELIIDDDDVNNNTNNNNNKNDDNNDNSISFDDIDVLLKDNNCIDYKTFKTKLINELNTIDINSFQFNHFNNIYDARISYLSSKLPKNLINLILNKIQINNINIKPLELENLIWLEMDKFSLNNPFKQGNLNIIDDKEIDIDIEKKIDIEEEEEEEEEEILKLTITNPSINQSLDTTPIPESATLNNLVNEYFIMDKPEYNRSTSLLNSDIEKSNQRLTRKTKKSLDNDNNNDNLEKDFKPKNKNREAAITLSKLDTINNQFKSNLDNNKLSPNRPTKPLPPAPIITKKNIIDKSNTLYETPPRKSSTKFILDNNNNNNNNNSSSIKSKSNDSKPKSTDSKPKSTDSKLKSTDSKSINNNSKPYNYNSLKSNSNNNNNNKLELSESEIIKKLMTMGIFEPEIQKLNLNSNNIDIDTINSQKLLIQNIKRSNTISRSNNVFDSIKLKTSNFLNGTNNNNNNKLKNITAPTLVNTSSTRKVIDIREIWDALKETKGWDAETKGPLILRNNNSSPESKTPISNNNHIPVKLKSSTIITSNKDKKRNTNTNTNTTNINNNKSLPKINKSLPKINKSLSPTIFSASPSTNSNSNTNTNSNSTKNISRSNTISTVRSHRSIKNRNNHNQNQNKNGIKVLNTQDDGYILNNPYIRNDKNNDKKSLRSIIKTKKNQHNLNIDTSNHYNKHNSNSNNSSGINLKGFKKILNKAIYGDLSNHNNNNNNNGHIRGMALSSQLPQPSSPKSIALATYLENGGDSSKVRFSIMSLETKLQFKKVRMGSIKYFSDEYSYSSDYFDNNYYDYDDIEDDDDIENDLYLNDNDKKEQIDFLNNINDDIDNYPSFLEEKIHRQYSTKYYKQKS